VQFYVHQETASVARPIREFKGFRSIHLKAGEKTAVSFSLSPEDLAFYNQRMQLVTEQARYTSEANSPSNDRMTK
jgi:beta-glucosidase